MIVVTTWHCKHATLLGYSPPRQACAATHREREEGVICEWSTGAGCWCTLSVAAISLCEITSEGVYDEPSSPSRSAARETTSGLLYYIRASRKRLARAAEARRLSIDYVLRTEK